MPGLLSNGFLIIIYLHRWGYYAKFCGLMVDAKNVLPDDKTILKAEGEGDGRAPSKQFAPYIVIVDGPHQGTRFQLHDGDNLIGRSVSSVAMLEDQSVSRRHAVLNHGPAGFVVRDDGSKNGTLVNGRRAKEPVNIGHGDVIRVGIYALRLITKEVAIEEELAPLPEGVEGKTVMISASQQAPSGEPHGETKTMAGSADASESAETGQFSVEGQGTEVGGEGLPLPEELPEKKRSPVLTYAMMAASVALVAAIGSLAYWKFLNKPPKAPSAMPAQGVVGTAPIAPVVPVVPESKTVPVFLDFASSPLPARITFDGKDYGLAPVKVNLELEVGKTYAAQGAFTLEELQDERIVQTTFVVEKDSNIIPILFKGQIGLVKVMSLPRDTQLYLEGNYADDQFKSHTAKLNDVVFGKPLYIPYGKYLIELRQPKQVGESSQFVEDIRLRREFLITEDNPVYEVSVAEGDLQKFPAEIRSIPEKADLFLDGQLVGQTPYKGSFPLGEHKMALRKDGYFEYTQDLKMDMNVIYQVEIPLKTTVAGEYINAGNLLLNKGLYKDAIAQFAEAFKNSPTPRETAQTQYLLGSAYLRLGDAATALGYFEQAKSEPEYQYPAMLGLASIYGSQNDMGRALPILVEVMLKSKDEQVKNDATAVFRQVSPLRSVMYIYTEPEGASVVVNDKPVTQKTPLILHDLGLGNYKIKIRKDGFVPQDLNINMSIAEFNPVIIKLKPVEE